jgi:hypothetical protein
MNGQLVRDLRAGYQDAGLYLTKTRALYWDGKSNEGEIVASGTYFYVLEGQSGVRRMVVIR